MRAGEETDNRLQTERESDVDSRVREKVKLGDATRTSPHSDEPEAVGEDITIHTDWEADPAFCDAQDTDPSLDKVRSQVSQREGREVDPRRRRRWPRAVVEAGLWFREMKEKGREWRQTLVPDAYREAVLQAAHDHPWAGHQGAKPTLHRILARFYWPTIAKDTNTFCRSCEVCQCTSHRDPARAPLAPLPVIGEPFARIAMDFVGPLPRTQRGARYLLVIIDYATRYPEAIPLPNMRMARALMHFFPHVGLPKEILTDRGTPFTAQAMKGVCEKLHIRQLFTAVHHPQTDGLAERLNQTIKAMLRKLAYDHPTAWDLYVDPLLFALRETPQSSTGFAPFELLYGRIPRGIVGIAEEQWARGPEEVERPPEEHLYLLQYRLETARGMARQNLERARDYQKRRYDQGTRARVFQVGDSVLVARRVLAKSGGDPWQGPFPVVRVLGPLSYEVRCGRRAACTKRLHVNDLKEWQPRSPPTVCTLTSPPGELPEGPEVPSRDGVESIDPVINPELSPRQVAEVLKVI